MGPINYQASGFIQDKIRYCNDPDPLEIPKQECEDNFKTFHTKRLYRRGITTYEIYFYTGPTYSRTPTGIMNATIIYKFCITWYCVALKPRPLGSERGVTRADDLNRHCITARSWQINPLLQTGKLMRQQWVILLPIVNTLRHDQ